MDIVHDFEATDEFFSINSQKNQIAFLALKILNKIPTLDSENRLVLADVPNWDEFYCLNRPYLFLYRIYSVIHLLEEGNMKFYQTGGLSKLIYLIPDIFKTFQAMTKELQLILSVIMRSLNSLFNLIKENNQNELLEIISNKKEILQTFVFSIQKEFKEISQLLLDIILKFVCFDSSFFPTSDLDNIISLGIFDQNLE